MTIATAITACRLCGGNGLTSIINFGNPYISDFLDPGALGTRAPLQAVRCTACGLVQLLHTVDRNLLYADRYWYRSGANESMVAALGDIARIAADSLKVGDRVLDIGANDGTLLSLYPDRVHKVAVEPSGLAQDGLARHADVIVRDFWPTEIEGNFKRITTIACFYDADDPHAFVQAIKEALAPDGLWIVQFQDADSILRQNAVDYFCHEHLCLWNPIQFGSLCAEHDLHVIRVMGNDINGGSLRFFVGHGENKELRPKTELEITSEDARARQWQDFAEKAQRLRKQAQEWSAQSDIIHGIAASTKANYLLQWYGIDASTLQAIVERAPEKIGKTTVNSIPIISEDQAAELRPDYYVALAWHFLDGFRQRYPDVPFITLLPEVKTYPAWNAARQMAGVE